MNVKENMENGISVVTVSGRLDNDGVEELEHKVTERLETGTKRLVFDFSDLEYINSSGLRVLVMAYQRLHTSGGRVGVCGLRDYILEIFEISGYDRLFALYPAKDAALDELGA
ncbi:MAG: STAS domain-containing protein [Desulfovibrionaceae bacterium]|jgi:anti-sigma B factor antagonist